MKVQDSHGRSLNLEIHESQIMPNAPVDYYLRYKGSQFSYVFLDYEQIDWVVKNRPPAFLEWLDSLSEHEDVITTSVSSVNYGGIQDDGTDLKYNAKCVCSFDMYLRAIALGRKCGDMSNYVRVDNMGQPLPRHLQA